MRSFQAAKSKVKSKSDKGDDYITRNEYRWLLYYVRQYYEYWIAFDEIDTDEDRRIGMDEFAKAIPKMEEWGIDMSNPQA